MTALSASPFRSRLFEASSWTPELRKEARNYTYDNLDSYGVEKLYELVFSSRTNMPLLKRDIIEAVMDGTTPGHFLAYWTVLHAKGLNHVRATSYHHSRKIQRDPKT